MLDDLSFGDILFCSEPRDRGFLSLEDFRHSHELSSWRLKKEALRANWNENQLLIIATLKSHLSC